MIGTHARIYWIKTIRSSKENIILNVQLFKKYTKLKHFSVLPKK